MDVKQVLRMDGGVGDASYATNSKIQEKAIGMAMAILEQAMIDLYGTSLPEKMAIADLGCSFGPNALLVIAKITNMFQKICCQHGRDNMEIQFLMNDLPGNDFNSIFRELPSFQRKLEREGKEKGKETVQFYVMGVPGSFYERLFPKHSIHVFHSSYGLHWLSQVPQGLESVASLPPNKGNIFLTETSPLDVFQCYLQQFRADFSMFLKLRSEEIVPGGAMVVALLGRGNEELSCQPTSNSSILIGMALNDMVKQGLVEDAKVDAFNMPFFAPSIKELKEVIQNQGSFTINQLKVVESSWTPMDDCNPFHVLSNLERGQKVARNIRAFTGPILSSHFGEEIVDDIFSRVIKYIANNPQTRVVKFVNLCLSMYRKG